MKDIWDFIFQWATVTTQAASAIGALAAVWAALHLARQASDRDSKDRGAIGMVIAGIVIPEVGILIRDLMYVADLLEQRAASPGGIAAPSDPENDKKLREVTEVMRLDSCFKVADRLHYLPDQRGQAAGYILGLLAQAKDNLQGLVSAEATSVQARAVYHQNAYLVVGRMASLACTVLETKPDSPTLSTLHSAMRYAEETFRVEAGVQG